MSRLHYAWLDIGTPNVSFLVALDAGSDLLWVPCDCIQCAPLSGYRGSLVGQLSALWSHHYVFLVLSFHLCILSHCIYPIAFVSGLLYCYGKYAHQYQSCFVLAIYAILLPDTCSGLCLCLRKKRDVKFCRRQLMRMKVIKVL